MGATVGDSPTAPRSADAQWEPGLVSSHPCPRGPTVIIAALVLTFLLLFRRLNVHQTNLPSSCFWPLPVT